MIEAGPRRADAAGVSRCIADAVGRQAGPTLVVVGGVHANEPAGIEAAERVHARMAEREIELRAGRVVSLRGNLAALAARAPQPWLRERYIDEDLNRAFHPDALSAEAGCAEHGEQAGLARALESLVNDARGRVYLIDLHTMSSDSPAFIALEDSLPARRFASLFPLPKILGLEEELRGLLIDYATNELDCVSCIVEAGRHDDPRSADVHEAILLLAIEALGMVGPGVRTKAGEVPHEVVSHAAGGRARHFYDVRERAAIESVPFSMQPGASAFMPVVANRTVVAVEGTKPRRAGASGLLFLPNRQASPRVGDDAFFVVSRVGGLWLAMSAWLRERPWVHKALPVVLPGVRSRQGKPGSIVVAPEYAALLRREVLHLMGYRLVRWHHAPYLPWHRRAIGLMGGLARAVVGVVRFAPRGGERAALPSERDNDWIATRRRLDVVHEQAGERGDRA